MAVNPLASSMASGQSTAALAIQWSRLQLPNGLDVILAPDSSTSEVSIEWWVHAGARDEAPGRFGLAHFFEHATPFGQGLVRTRAGRQLYDSLRTNSNAKTRFDYTRYYLEARPEGLDYFLLVVADRMRADPTLELTAERVEAHRKNVAAEIERASRGSWGWPVSYRLQLGTFGPGHPYGHSVYGSEAETRAVVPDDMLRWFRANIRPEYTTLLVVGKFDSAAARLAIERTFGGIPAGARPPRAAPVLPRAIAGVDTVSITADTGYVFLSWPIPGATSPERAPLALLARILTERLAARPPIPAAAVAEAEFLELAGRFTLRARLGGRSQAEADAVAARLRREVAAVVANGATEGELQRARQADAEEVRTELRRLGFEESRTELLGEGALFADDPDLYLKELAREADVTPEQARNAARTWLQSPGYLLIVRGTRNGSVSQQAGWRGGCLSARAS